jgi:four helix bundle protein
LSIGLKEANETEYWLLLLKHSKYVNSEKATDLIQNNNELKSILIASIKTAKKNK